MSGKCISLLGVSILPLLKIFLLNFGIVPSVIFFFIQINENKKYKAKYLGNMNLSFENEIQ